MKYGRIGAHATSSQQCLRVPEYDSERIIFVTGLAAVTSNWESGVGATGAPDTGFCQELKHETVGQRLALYTRLGCK